MFKNKNWARLLTVPIIASLLITGCAAKETNSTNSGNKQEGVKDNKDKPATWIADRKIKGLIFMGADDYTEEMNPEVLKQIKEKTGIDYQINIMPANRSLDGLIAGLASGDLPDFIGFYLNHSGRPEMPVVLKAAREGMFTDLTPFMKDTKVYSKYLEDGYLPLDTKNGVMFRPEFNGSAYFMHMNISRETGYETRKMLGGPFIRKDIAEALNIDPKTITTSEKLYEAAQKIKAGNFKDNNGKDIASVIGPRYWGGTEVKALYSDLTVNVNQTFVRNKEGKIVHESQTEYPLKRVAFVQKLLKEKLMNPEFYTMEENRATEGILNGSFAIIADMHNYLEFNKDMHYLPIGPLNEADKPYQMKLSYKTAGGAWAIPSSTKNPEDIVKFADFLASREGKLLWQYGIEGRDYTLDDKGNPIVKNEVLELKDKDSKAAKALGFAGVGNYWGEILGNTDVDRIADFGETEYGNAAKPNINEGPLKIAEYWEWDKKRANAIISDTYAPTAFLGEFAKETELKAALDNYDESLKRAYYAKSQDQVTKILESASEQLKAAGLDDYLALLEKKDSDPNTKVEL
ncbi:ABC transporter [Paenibacillus sp. FSL A5-0031]|uniref:extracellular solute-binding protein n=1 Tax=Paenibacillus sp. FSL A5-0031 TaxID=1920420 RepID=UPI00096F4E9F|nr:extracellular solute-binding protein [Paenibacillus sp. FSL A5-0031]OME87981.1 ABC transporter [Paenibacillus sp. FSL A5-0031]